MVQKKIDPKVKAACNDICDHMLQNGKKASISSAVSSAIIVIISLLAFVQYAEGCQGPNSICEKFLPSAKGKGLIVHIPVLILSFALMVMFSMSSVDMQHDTVHTASLKQIYKAQNLNLVGMGISILVLLPFCIVSFVLNQSGTKQKACNYWFRYVVFGLTIVIAGSTVVGTISLAPFANYEAKLEAEKKQQK